jgi:anti-anti-sigma factor
MTYSLEQKRLRVVAAGDVLSSSVETMRSEFRRVMQSPEVRDGRWEVLTLDLSAARMVDSAGLNFIVGIIREAKARGRKVAATVANRTVHRTFVFTRLDKQVELVAAPGFDPAG